MAMETQRKILLVDDDPDLLDVYQEVLKQLPGAPKIHVTSSGAEAIAMLEASPFHLLITDLRMPRMDGLQVISIVRRKYPALRTVVLTSVLDEQFRARVYALGVDLFWQKPATETEMGMFRDCIQSLLERQDGGGFRGVQSKSLMDIIQLECLSQNSVLLRIINGPLEGRIWINQGELFDAETGGVNGEAAFTQILGWKAGCFESLTPDPKHPRVIQKSVNALLLESAQALDEAQSPAESNEAEFARRTGANPLKTLEGFEFLLPFSNEGNLGDEGYAVENAGHIANWSRSTWERFTKLGDELQVAEPEIIIGLGRQRHLGLARRGEINFCAGWSNNLNAADVRKSTKKATALWVS